MSTVVALVLVASATPAAADRIDDEVLRAMRARHIPGLSLAVVRDGKVIKSAGYGVASLELQVPVTPQTVFELGSITKQFTAEAIMLLVDDGKLTLDDRLSGWVDGLPAAWSAITLRHVLTHTGGIPDFDTGKIGFSYRATYTARDFVALLAAQPLAFAAGDRWMYSNSFPLLGIVVERASGLPFEQFVTDRIFKPAGMTSSRFIVSTDVVSNRAQGYTYVDGAYRRGETARPAIIAPNGGILTTVEDLARWDIALSSGRLLRPSTWSEMIKPLRLNSGQAINHGLAWFMDSFNGHRFLVHWGATAGGFSAVTRHYVDDHLTVIMLANLEDGAFGVDAISKRVAGMYVDGVDWRQLQPARDTDAALTAKLKSQLRPEEARDLSAIEFLVEEPAGPQFLTDPKVARLRRYRVRTSSATWGYTFQLAADGAYVDRRIEPQLP